MKLPLAKNGDSIIILQDQQYIEVWIDRVESIYIDNQYHWLYYLRASDGYNEAIFEDKILMNLTTQMNFTIENENNNDFIKI